MKRRLHISLLAMLFVLALAFAASTQEARAQAPNSCCTFKISASCVHPAGCFPFTVTTSWGGAIQNDVVTGCGVAVYPIATCPPAPATFDWVSIDGGITRFGVGGSGNILLPCGTCLKIIVTTDAAGCYHIHLTRC